MSENLIDRNLALQRLMDEGYEVEIRHQYLLVHEVPYVTAKKTLGRGTLACTYIDDGNGIQIPDNHQVWFTGEFPCHADGTPISQLDNENGKQLLFDNFWIRHRFSNKPVGLNAFSDHYSKMLHYVGILSDQAKVLDALADARTGKVIETTEEESVFRYPDTASARAEIVAVSQRLELQKVAIVGLGGTGSYILDHVAKTLVKEIHLFDGDKFRTHNAFRAPGAAHIDELRQQIPKATYFKQRYEPMRRGLISHEYYLDETNTGELAGFDFVFVCVDKGPTRATLCSYLHSKNIPFVDVGMSIEMVPETGKLVGTCRFTTSTASQNDHIGQYVPMMEDEEDAIYGKNIQVADMNALNAVLAVMKWKQLFGFYQDDFESHHGTFSVSSQSLTRDVMTNASEP